MLNGKGDTSMNIRNMKRTVCILVTITTMALAGCGGGGGGPMMGQQTMSLSEKQLYGNLENYKKVADNSPMFGSITQSSNGNSGISTDRVETELSQSGELTVRVKDGSGNVSLELNSSNDKHTDLKGTPWLADANIPSGWNGDAWVLSKQDGNDVVVALAYTSWEDSDETNYLAGGYWVKANAAGVTEMGTFGDAGESSIFGYYDGQNASWQRPVTGTATYRGAAEGAYVNDDEAGVWWSELVLDANFAARSISGCVGCQRAAINAPAGIYTYTTIEDLKADDYMLNDLSISLAGAKINDNGSFDEGTLRVVGGDSNASQGKWGGLFSESSNSASTPTHMAGTLAGTAGDIGFVGVFTGEK